MFRPLHLGTKLTKMVFVSGELLQGLCGSSVVTQGTIPVRSSTCACRFQLLGLNPLNGFLLIPV